MCEVLSVFETETLKFCEERSTASIILPTLLFLRKFLERIKVDSLAAQTLVASLKEALDVRTSSLRENSLLVATMLLDPRFGHDNRLNTDWKKPENFVISFFNKSLS
jgi:hypothetical protein